mgnify:FL=1
MRGRDEFPPLLLLRRYLKLAIDWVRTKEMVNVPLADASMLFWYRGDQSSIELRLDIRNP